jgi:hypothetical protein
LAILAMGALSNAGREQGQCDAPAADPGDRGASPPSNEYIPDVDEVFPRPVKISML